MPRAAVSSNFYKLSKAFDTVSSRFLWDKEAKAFIRAEDVTLENVAKYELITKNTFLSLLRNEGVKATVIGHVLDNNTNFPTIGQRSPMGEEDWETIRTALTMMRANQEEVQQVREAFIHDARLNRTLKNLPETPDSEECLKAIYLRLLDILRDKGTGQQKFEKEVLGEVLPTSTLGLSLSYMKYNGTLPSDTLQNIQGPDALPAPKDLNEEAMWALGEKLGFTKSQQNILHELRERAEAARALEPAVRSEDFDESIAPDKIAERTRKYKERGMAAFRKVKTVPDRVVRIATVKQAESDVAEWVHQFLLRKHLDGELPTFDADSERFSQYDILGSDPHKAVAVLTNAIRQHREWNPKRGEDSALIRQHKQGNMRQMGITHQLDEEQFVSKLLNKHTDPKDKLDLCEGEWDFRKLLSQLDRVPQHIVAVSDLQPHRVDRSIPQYQD